MTQADIRPIDGHTRASWIRLRTMILLRWIAIFGQLTAITVATALYDLQLQLGLCYLVIGTSVAANLLATLLFPENKRLSDGENLGFVMFDLLQLGMLLFLTGGLHNPFALLLLGPVTISATALSLRSTLVLCGTAILLVSLLAVAHLPLLAAGGQILQIPAIFVFGHWLALIIALLFTSGYSRRVTSEIHSMADALAATQLALAREQKLTDLGGVVAAAAHELGTPLATIKLASSELLDELSDQPLLAEDAALIAQQADRCRDILRDMGRMGKDDLHMRHAPLMVVLSDAAEPHTRRGKSVHFLPDPPVGQPTILRKPEIIHGIRNLIQNAVDFARCEVRVEAGWSDDHIRVRIEDDGPGFPPHLLGRIGDPFMHHRPELSNQAARPEYVGMGLGMFIAKTLLERSGAVLSFANMRDAESSLGGAMVEVVWPRSAIELHEGELAAPLGPNRRIVA